MSLTLLFFLLSAGATVGFFSGLLGIGGGIIMFPLLLYVPPLFGLEEIGVKSITGLTMIQGFFASLTAMLFYKRHKLVHTSLVLTLGFSLFCSSFAGAIFSKRVHDSTLLIIFGALSFIAALLMFVPRSYARDNETHDTVYFNKTIAVMIGTVLGFLVGLVGQGGAFILIPLLLYVLKIPLRVTLGSTLAIGLFSSSAGLAGKALTGQVPFSMALPLLAGAIPVALLGSYVGKRTKTHYLRWALAFIISATAIKILIFAA